MAGHSHWANIVFKKGAADKKRGKLFGKLSRVIIVAARSGGGDPTMNLALRYAIDKAKKNSMPKDNIERAIKRGCGETDGNVFEEVLYEGYGPNGVAVLCEILTDNRNRTAGEVRRTFDGCGGNLGATGCVAWMFERKGLFTIRATDITEEQLFETALEAGADDVALDGDFFEVTCSVDLFQDISEALATANVCTETADVTQIATQTVDLDAAGARRALRLIDELEDNDDVQNVTENFTISNEVMAELSADV
jgi:YebC/PmpR family DNA-binding regulatory protein